MLNFNYWYYLVQIHKDEVEGRHGPFESEEDALAWLKHEKIEGHFDIVKHISTYWD